jgi:hypothetical protein
MVNVFRMDTAAMASGISARNEANRNTSTAMAPRPPSSVSASRLGPLSSAPFWDSS